MEQVEQPQELLQWTKYMRWHEKQVPENERVYLVISELSYKKIFGISVKSSSSPSRPSSWSPSPVRERPGSPHVEHLGQDNASRGRSSLSERQNLSPYVSSTHRTSSGNSQLLQSNLHQHRHNRSSPIRPSFLEPGLNSYSRYQHRKWYCPCCGVELPEGHPLVKARRASASRGGPPIFDVHSHSHDSDDEFADDDVPQPKPPPVRLEGSTAGKHWAVEVRSRFFELEVNNIEVAQDEFVERSRFSCSKRWSNSQDRVVTTRLFVGRTHMTDGVLAEIGKGIMNTQPKYSLLGDNCHHFVAVYLPRILCDKESFMPVLPNASKPPFKTSNFLLYKPGIRGGDEDIALVVHERLDIEKSLRNLLGMFQSANAEFKEAKKSEESRYKFILQTDNPNDFADCKYLDINPYRAVIRQTIRTENSAIVDIYSSTRKTHLWERHVGSNAETPEVADLVLEDYIKRGKTAYGYLKNWMQRYKEKRT